MGRGKLGLGPDGDEDQAQGLLGVGAGGGESRALVRHHEGRWGGWCSVPVVVFIRTNGNGGHCSGYNFETGL